MKLPPKLEAVLIRLCGKGRSLNVTQAVKLPYIVDVVAMHFLGRRITEGTHQTWDHGVVTSEVWHYFDKCETLSSFRLEPVRWSEETRVVVVDAPELLDTLTSEEQEIVDFVADEYASIKAGRLGRMTKLMNPDVSRWGSNQRADVGEEAYDRMSPDYQRMVARIASLTLDELRHSSRPLLNPEDAVA